MVILVSSSLIVMVEHDNFTLIRKKICDWNINFFIQADQSGTVVEILVEDGKPVSIDTVSFLDQGNLKDK